MTRAVWTTGSNPRCTKRGLQQCPVLETVAAATAGDEFGVHAVRIDANAASQQHIEILERDARHVCAKHTGSRGPNVAARGPVQPIRAR